MLGRKAVRNTPHRWLHVTDIINDHVAKLNRIHNIHLCTGVFMTAVDMFEIIHRLRV